MNIITQEAKKRQAVVEYAIKKKNKSKASRQYGVSLSSVKRWCKRYDGTWQSLAEKSHRPYSHPKRHTKKEEMQIKNSFKKFFARYGCCLTRKIQKIDTQNPKNTKVLKLWKSSKKLCNITKNVKNPD